MFRKVDGARAILSDKSGGYTPVEVYTCLGNVYAKHGRSFVRLSGQGSTSKAGVRLYAMEWSGRNLRKDNLGNLCIDGSIPDARELGKVNFKLVYV